MAKAAMNGGTAATGRNRRKNGTLAENGKDRPVLNIETNDKGQIKSHIRQMWLAVVSLPQETFYSSGASVKASLLFLGKFTEEEQAEFDKQRAAAKQEVENEYAGEIEDETTRLEAEKVGITATGEPDANELYPNERMPAGMTPRETCLELYRQFREDPTTFRLEAKSE